MICFLILICNSVGIVGPSFSWWTGPRFRTGRAVIFISSAFLSCLPIAYYFYSVGWNELPRPSENFGFVGLILMMILYLVGAFIYAKRLPEALAPGKFDYFLHSHQIWHCFVIAAALVHYYALRSLMVWRLELHTCNI
jgi:adiponectin receptor